MPARSRARTRRHFHGAHTRYWRYLLTYGLPRFSEPWKDRRGALHETLAYGRGVHGPNGATRLRTPEAPADWMQPDFDDSCWPRERRPEVGCEVESSVENDPIVRIRYLRGRFEAPDPGKVTSLSVTIEYVGGVIVYLNGREVRRANLPDGEIGYDMLAEGYPLEAYTWFTISNHGYPLVSPFAWDNDADRLTLSGWQPDGSISSRGKRVRWERPAGVKDVDRYRRLDIALDPTALRKGTNVLAIRVQQSGHHQVAANWTSNANQMTGFMQAWSHNAVRKVELRVEPAGAAPVQARPSGLQVWTDDIHHRAVNRDYGEAGDRAQVIRLVGARNGSYSGMVMVGCTEAVADLGAQMGELVSADGAARIPGSAVRVRYGVGQALDDAPRRDPAGSSYTYYYPSFNRMLERYVTPGGFRFVTTFGGDRANLFGGDKAAEIKAQARKIKRFDQLSAGPPPGGLPAGESMPVWITVRVPKDAAAGEYRGTLVIKAGRSRNVPVRLRVFDVALPDGKDYASFVGLRQDVMGVCLPYKAPRWSAEHWKLVEQSMQRLGQVGNDLVYLPLVIYSESGNDESIVPWVKKGDGYDYSWENLDRYLDLVDKHLGRDVDLVGDVCWVPWRGGKEGWPVYHKAVTFVEDGQKKDLPLPAVGSEEWKRLFPPFAKAVRAHLLKKGFRNLHWGWFYDGVTDDLRRLAEGLREAVPDVGWARSNHEAINPAFLGKDSDCRVTLNCHIRAWQFVYTSKGEPAYNYGWKNRGQVHFARAASWIQVLSVDEAPMGLRWMTESALVHNAAGWARMGADCWPPNLIASAGNWYADADPNLFYPAPGGPEAGARFEALREGVQEGELRILIERAARDREEPATSVLLARAELTESLSCEPGNPIINEYYGGWQERSWDLLAAAAAALGGQAPPAEDRAAFFASGSGRP